MQSLKCKEEDNSYVSANVGMSPDNQFHVDFMHGLIDEGILIRYGLLDMT